MDSNNNNKPFQQDDGLQPLPPGLEWNNMKDGILGKMQSIEKAELSSANNKSSKKRTWLFLSFFLLLSLIFSAGLFVLQQQDPSGHRQETGTAALTTAPGYEDQESANGVNTTPDHPADNTGEAIPAPAGTATPTDLLPSREETALSQGGGSGESEVASAKSAVANDLLQANEETALPQGGGSPRRTQTESGELSTSLPAAEQAQNHDGPDETRLPASHNAGETADDRPAPLTGPQPGAAPATYIPGIDGILPYPATNLLSGTAIPSPYNTGQADSVATPVIPRSKPVNQLVLEGGINFWNEGYGNSSPDRKLYEAPIPSFQVQGSYMKGLKGGYFLMAGLQYQQLESRLDYRDIMEDYQVILKDTIVEVRTNLMTGQETLIRGDAVQTVRAERIVRHYNKTQLLKTSLAFGKSWRFHHFQTDVYLGGALSGILANQGRMVYQDSVIDYNGTSNLFYQNRWTVDGVAGTRFHYFPYQKLGITAGFQAQRSLMNWSKQSDIRFYPLSFGLQFGLSYSL